MISTLSQRRSCVYLHHDAGNNDETYKVRHVLNISADAETDHAATTCDVGVAGPIIPASTCCCCCCCTDIPMFICIIALELLCIIFSENPVIIPAALFGTKLAEFPCIMPAEFPGIMGTMPGCWPRTYIWDIPPIIGWPAKKPRGWGGVVMRPSSRSTLLTVCCELFSATGKLDIAPVSPAPDLQPHM